MSMYRKNKNIRAMAVAAGMVLVTALSACGNGSPGNAPSGESAMQSAGTTVMQPTEPAEQVKTSVVETTVSQEDPSGEIYLYGELHSNEEIIKKEFELWKDYYHNGGLRHLFLESPYYTAEYLNLWMQAADDEILDEIYDDWEGSAAHNPYLKEFYQKIKEQCPETVFHGTDVGHQYETTGKRYLNYLRANQLENSRQYSLAQECIEQGKYYYENSDDAYRENKMAENFIRFFDALNGESVMGIYGGAHIGIESMDYSTQSVPSMANQLFDSYGDALHSEDLTWIKEDIDPVRIDTITVAGKEYEAAYFGKEDLTGVQDFSYREFWRLENAYDDLKNRPRTGDVLPYNNYPMLIETEQVFILELGKTDGSVVRAYYRSDGNQWEGMAVTEEFKAE